MPFEWISFLHVAVYLHSLEEGVLNKEACCRIAISRAYYATFCHARNYARDKQNFQPTNTDRDHELVYQHFLRSKYKGVASNLKQLRQWRNDADYKDDEIEQLLSKTPEIIKLASNTIGYINPPPSKLGS